jgi:uncharacterized integral membrane protein
VAGSSGYGKVFREKFIFLRNSFKSTCFVLWFGGKWKVLILGFFEVSEIEVGLLKLLIAIHRFGGKL